MNGPLGWSDASKSSSHRVTLIFKNERLPKTQTEYEKKDGSFKSNFNPLWE